MPTASSRSSSFLPRLAGAVAGLSRGWPALPTVFASVALSLISVYAIGVAESLQPHELTDLTPAALRQGVYLIVAVAASILILLPHYRLLGYASWGMLAVSVLLLVFLVLPGVPASIVRPRNGARSWIDFGALDFQPSEVAKIAYVLVLAWYLRFRKNHRTFAGLLPPAIITFIPCALILLQPDLGTAVLFIPALFAMLVAAGAKLKHLTLIVLIATLAAPAAYPLLRPHQKQRIVGLMLQLQGDKSADQDINMQSVTSQRLAGAGGYAGVGDARSRTLLHFNALPERKTDMIFSVICNRFGMVGGLAVIGLYGLWIVGALLTAAGCREPFGRLTCVGFTGFIGAQVMINAGMNLGLAPIIGITLPFLSYGGSSLVTVWLMTSIVANVALRRPRVSLRRSFEYDEDE